MASIKSDQEFVSYLLTKGINYRLYDYEEGKDPDKYPLMVNYRRYYQNPHLWQILFTQKETKAINYLVDKHNIDIDMVILITAVHQQCTQRMFEKLFYIVYNNEINKDKIMRLDRLVMATIEADSLDKTKYVFDKQFELKIEDPNYKLYELSDGRGLTEAAKIGNINMIKYLLDKGCKANSDGDWPVINAIKHGHYYVAKILMERGADIHSKRNLGLKCILRNDKEENKLDAKDRAAREILLQLYKE